MDHSAGASSEHLEARSELLLVTSLELAAAQGTVGKLSISAFRWRRQREPSEPSLAISTAMDHPRKVACRRKVPELADTPSRGAQNLTTCSARYPISASAPPSAFSPRAPDSASYMDGGPHTKIRTLLDGGGSLHGKQVAGGDYHG